MDDAERRYDRNAKRGLDDRRRTNSGHAKRFRNISKGFGIWYPVSKFFSAGRRRRLRIAGIAYLLEGTRDFRINSKTKNPTRLFSIGNSKNLGRVSSRASVLGSTWTPPVRDNPLCPKGFSNLGQLGQIGMIKTPLPKQYILVDS
jgi:hypothetical protein